MKLLMACQLKEWDAETIRKEPISSRALMLRAATACTDWILNNYGLGNYFIFCGAGNNAGDGLVIARQLVQAGANVKVFLVGPGHLSAGCAWALSQLPTAPEVLDDVSKFPASGAGVIFIDALFGTGLNKPPTGISAALIEWINHAHSGVISIDLPSGMYADAESVYNIKIKATHTLSFEIPKLAFFITENLPYCGRVHILDIGLHADYMAQVQTQYFAIDKPLAQALWKPRPAWVHKYLLGHVLLFAGSPGMMGAALLCAKACMRSGVGLATLKTEAAHMQVVHTALPEVIATDETDWDKLCQKKNALLLGPGMQVNEENAQWLRHILNFWKLPLLLDAAGLALLQPLLSDLQKRPAGLTVLTPHAGEFDRLFGKAATDFERIQTAGRQAVLLGCYIILKGPHTLVACPDGAMYFNTTGNSGMATAGSGDVLAGMVAALMAGQYDVKAACLLAVYLHGLAGDFAADELSKEGMMASDIINHLPIAFKKLQAYQLGRE